MNGYETRVGVVVGVLAAIASLANGMSWEASLTNAGFWFVVAYVVAAWWWGRQYRRRELRELQERRRERGAEGSDPAGSVAPRR